MSVFKAKERTVLFHIPHAGDLFPEELMESICIPEEEFYAYHETMKDSGLDLLTGSVFPPPVVIRFGVSRLLCDVERFIGPEEIMEQYGMGFCYERAFDGRVIKNVTEELREKTLKYYRAHHERMDGTIRSLSRAVMIDLHSFSEDLVMPDRKDGRPMPEICIGTGGGHTPPTLSFAAEKAFSEAGFSVALNYPYAGSMVPNCILQGGTDCDFMTVMIEINKTVLFDENGRESCRNRTRIRRALKKLTRDL